MLTKSELDAWQQASGWVVALSGGLDSSVLLHLLHSYRQHYGGPPLRAIHIEHGLQQAALAWPQHCRQLCSSLGVPLSSIAVKVADSTSVEQAARQARYQAFADNLAPGEVLMLGQHADDQAETLLLRLLRGAGVNGLQGMPRQRPLGKGMLLRPLLGIPRQRLLEYAQQQALGWIEDPSNQHDEFDRNYLRNQVMPLLKQRWPGVLSVFGRTCGQMCQAGELLAELAQMDLARAAAVPVPDWLRVPALDLAAIQQLSRPRQINLLRCWLSDKTLPPDERHWAGWDDLCHAAADAQPYWRLQAGVLLRSAHLLYWLSQIWLQPPPAANLGPLAAGRHELPGNGSLLLAGCEGLALHLRYRQGGEVVQLPGRGRRDLKRLLQEQQVPWFMRARLPLLYQDGQLVAVANYPQLSQLPDIQCCWQPPL